jgi:hypothetical protein
MTNLSFLHTVSFSTLSMPGNTVEDRLSEMPGTWPAPDKRFFRILDILTKYIYNYTIYIFVNNAIYILLKFNALKNQLSTQCYEPSTTAHVVRKLLTVVVAFGTTIPNLPSIITLFGCSRCLDFQIKDLLLYTVLLCCAALDVTEGSYVSYPSKMHFGTVNCITLGPVCA